MVAAWIRTAAIRRGQPPPILYERELDARDDGTLIVDVDKVQAAVEPDPKLYRKLEGGGYTYIPAEEVWLGDTTAIRRRQRNERRRARRAERKARRAAEAAQPGPIDITPAKKPPGESG
jgi:hypothetical protein